MQSHKHIKITDFPFIDHWEDGKPVYHKGITKELVIQILDNQEKAEKIHDYQEIIIDKKIDFGAIQ